MVEIRHRWQPENQRQPEKKHAAPQFPAGGVFFAPVVFRLPGRGGIRCQKSKRADRLISRGLPKAIIGYWVEEPTVDV